MAKTLETYWTENFCIWLYLFSTLFLPIYFHLLNVYLFIGQSLFPKHLMFKVYILHCYSLAIEPMILPLLVPCPYSCATGSFLAFQCLLPLHHFIWWSLHTLSLLDSQTWWPLNKRTHCFKACLWERSRDWWHGISSGYNIRLMWVHNDWRQHIQNSGRTTYLKIP